MTFADNFAAAKEDLWDAACGNMSQYLRLYGRPYSDQQDMDAFAASLQEALWDLDFMLECDPAEFLALIDDLGAPVSEAEIDATIDVLADGQPDPVHSADPTVRGHLVAAKDDLDRVAVRVSPWTGMAASGFKELLTSAYPPAITAQMLTLVYLRAYLRAMRSVITEARRTVIDMLDAAAAGFRLDQGGGGDATFAFILVGAAAAMLGGLPVAATVTAVAGVTEAAAGLGGYFYAEELPEESDRPTTGLTRGFEGFSPYDLLDQLRNRITELRGFIADEDRTVADALAKDVEWFGPANADVFVPEMPASGHQLGDYDHFKPDDPYELLADCDELYYTGYVDMSSAAWHYDMAAWRLNVSAQNHESAAFGTWFGQSVSGYRSLRMAFAIQALMATRDNLVRDGEALCATALYYADRDDLVSGDLQAHFDGYVTEMNTQQTDVNHQNRPTLNEPPASNVPFE
jgi:hypothetical protein